MIWPIADGVRVVGAGRLVRLGTRGANEILPVCGGHAVDVTPRMLLSPHPHPICIGLPFTIRTVTSELESQSMSQRRRMMVFGHRGAAPK